MTALEEVGRLADVPLQIEVELDSRFLPIRDVLDLDVGAILKMTRSAGENLNVMIGGVLVCYGEIVVTETTVGLRITDFNEEE